ncbi:hypothetical protein ACTWQF_09195 [Streptomyces sp. 8N114]|uniref:hypothetical protein n=1 Tax=Streptomyces sp. 8N114 TaxID=3457419 RepID=UPI003FD26D7B
MGAMGVAEELYGRVLDAVAGTPYRMVRTERGFDLTVDVHEPRRTEKQWTYRVQLRAEGKVYTLTDVVRTVEYGPGGMRKRTETSVGRSLYKTRYRAVDGTEYSFSSADGHRLIRGIAEELGWQEQRPASVTGALWAGVAGGVVALGVLIALAVAYLLGMF